jgi:L-lactate dehydrogenase
MKHRIHVRRRNKVSVIGAGLVGSTYAYTLMLSGAASEIVLLDARALRAEGEAMDLSHGAPFAPPVRIRSGDWDATSHSDIVVITAGAAQEPGETRLDLAKRNVEVFRDIVPKAAEASPDSIILVVTNPVDLMSYAAIMLSGFPANRVIGSGTLLDSARFRQLIGKHCSVAPANVHAYIIGEHGDSEVPLWSTANIAGLRLDEYCPVCGRACDRSVRTRIFEEVCDAAYAVIERKGATYYAIALALTAVTRAILRDENAVMTVSCLIDGFCGADNICLSLPAVVNRAGIDRLLHIPLTQEECESFQQSARILQDAAISVGLRD